MSTATRRALYGRLASDTTLDGMLATPAAGYVHAIYYQQGPEEIGYPFVIFSKTSGIPADTMSVPGALESDVWLVKAVDKSNTADTAEAIAARVIALLNDATLSISGAVHLYLRRESDVQYPEITAGEVYQHCGAMFRLMYSPS